MREAAAPYGRRRPRGSTSEGIIPSGGITSAEWDFAVGPGRMLLRKLGRMPTKLGDVADRIFQGLVTSADPIYLLEPTGPVRKGLVPVRCAADGGEYQLEVGVVKPLCKGSLDMRRYFAAPSKRVVFPYDVERSSKTRKTVLVPSKDFANRYPATWQYLMHHRETLRNREKGKMRREGWYGYVYPKSVSQFARKKILTPSIAARASYTLDSDTDIYFVGSGGGGGGGYGIILKDDCLLGYEYVLGLLNSRLLDWMVRRVSSRFRGGYYAFSRQYLENLPIRTINFADTVDKAKHDRMVELVERMLDLHKTLHAAKTERDKELLQRQIDATDRLIDALVYELYGLTDKEIAVVEGEAK